MDRLRPLTPPVGPGSQYVERAPVTQAEKRAAATNKRSYDRETGEMPTRLDAAQEHAANTKRADP